MCEGHMKADAHPSGELDFQGGRSAAEAKRISPIARKMLAQMILAVGRLILGGDVDPTDGLRRAYNVTSSSGPHIVDMKIEYSYLRFRVRGRRPKR